MSSQTPVNFSCGTRGTKMYAMLSGSGKQAARLTWEGFSNYVQF